MKCKLIVSDMDGTLFNSEKEITKKNIEAINKVIEKKVRFVIVTGRQSKEINMLIKKYNLFLDIIGLNGAEIRNSQGNVIWKKKIEEKAVNKIIDILIKNQVFFKCYGVEEVIVNCPPNLREILLGFVVDKYGRVENEEEDIKKYYKRLCPNARKEANIKEYIEKNNLDILKIEILDTDQDLLRNLEDQISNINRLNVTKSFKNNIEIVNEEVDKGNAVKIFAEKLGVDKKYIVAFGDNWNDIEMIKYSGIGVAMENSIDEVKKVSKFITLSNNNDGVAYGIENFITF
ncbi:MAG: HAD family phosphatase [Clostridium sp.]|nr:HAD family phosphatase [Clostridium sp.]